MDLDYPSEKRHDLSRQMKNLDRRYGSIILSNPKIEASKKIIPRWIKKKILNYVNKDQFSHLLFFMEREAINVRDEISDEELGWNVLHFCAKLNAYKCTQNLLRNIYQEESKYYSDLINSKTREGDTPLLIACQYYANRVAGILLEAGGVDIYTTNDKKVMAYQIAFSENNEEVLKQLMRYEMRSKQKNGINIQFLQKKVEKQDEFCCQTLFDCFLGLFGIQSNKIVHSKQIETNRNMIKNQEPLTGLPQIAWLQPDVVFSKQIPLFSSISSPFSIKQGSIIVSNLLIIFQSLAYYPELLRNIILKDKTQYSVLLHKNNKQSEIKIDPVFPFFKQTHQPLFLSLNEELWPMILQKALCQIYNGYFQPGKISIENILETITSNIAYKIKLSNQTNQQYSLSLLLANLQSHNCIHILKPSKNCPLQNEDGRIQCFSILKRAQGKYLINCPFKSKEGERREFLQTKQMKIQKIHYINQSTQPIWVSQEQFFKFFEQIVFCHTHNPRRYISIQKINLTASQDSNIRFYLSIKYPFKTNKNTVPFHPEPEPKDRGLSISLKVKSLIDRKEGVLKHEQSISVKKCSGWTMKNRKNIQKIDKIERISCSIFGQAMIPIEQVYNQVFLQVEVNLDEYYSSLAFCLSSQANNNREQKSFVQQLQIINKSSEKVDIQILDSFIGDLEFIQCYKNYCQMHIQEFDGPTIQKIGEYTIIIVPTTHQCYIEFQKGIDEDDIIEGCLSGAKLDLLQYKDIQYAVIMSGSRLQANSLRIFINQEVETAESIIKALD